MTLLVPRVGLHGFFREADQHLEAHGDEYDAVVESVSTRPFMAHRYVGRRAVALYHQVADEVWEQEFPFPVGVIGRRVLEPRWIAAMAGSTIVAVSRSTAEALEARGLEVTAVVPPGCDPAGIRRDAPSAAPRLLFIGRMVRTKRPLDAISAYQHVRASLPESTLDVAGEGYLLGTVRRHATPGVTVHGWVDAGRKRRLLAAADVLLAPGTREGWGIVVLEAAAHGVPAVAYDIPGLRDSVLQAQTGYLVPAYPGAMAAGVTALLREPGRWGAFSAAAWARAREHTWERSAASLLSVVEDAAKHGRPARPGLRGPVVSGDPAPPVRLQGGVEEPGRAGAQSAEERAG